MDIYLLQIVRVQCKRLFIINDFLGKMLVQFFTIVRYFEVILCREWITYISFWTENEKTEFESDCQINKNK